MAKVAQTYKDKLKDMLHDVSEYYEYFRENNARFNEFYRFIFKSTLTENDIVVLTETQKPMIEFNILEAYISRLRGEFSKYEPDICIHTKGNAPESEAMLKFLEGHFRHLLHDANNDNFEYNIYTDLLAGGFSAAKMYTEYSDPMSFEHNICLRRVFDPTMCVFDPQARQSHKADGEYAGEIYPMTRKSFEETFGKKATQTMRFTRSLGAFNWSYASVSGEEYVMVCDYYRYKKKKTKIVQLVNGHTMTVDDYERFLASWDSMGQIAQPPTIIGKARTTEIKTVERFWICETDVLDHKDTNYKYFPVFFIDGNSVIVRENQQGLSKQLTRPYVYNAMGIQKMKNFAGQCFANELENMVQHKWMVPLEGIPEGYADAYKNAQVPNVVVYNAFMKDTPASPIPAPQAIQRAQIPPEIAQAFTLSDEVTRAILGTFDMDLSRLTENQISGIAIQESMSMSNTAAMPYIVGFLRGLNHAANMYIDLMPKYMPTPRTVPVMRPDGQRSYERINEQPSMNLGNYSNKLEAEVTAGVNFQLQKNQAYQQIVMLMKISPEFNEFINAEGIDVLLDNIEMRGIEQIKERAEEYMKQKKQAQAQAPKTPPPEVMQFQLAQQELQQKAQLEQQKNQRQAKKDEIDAALETASIAIDEQRANTEQMLAMAKLGEIQTTADVAREKAAAENARSAVDMAIKVAEVEHKDRAHAMDVIDQQHRHAKESVELAHQILQTNKNEEEPESEGL